MASTEVPPLLQSTDGAVRYGALTISPAGLAVSVNALDVPVTLSEFLLLKALATHPYQVFDRVTLAGIPSACSKGHDERRAAVSPRSVDLHISRLRRKLRQAGCDCIRTMRYAGYRFVPTSLSGGGPA